MATHRSRQTYIRTGPIQPLAETAGPGGTEAPRVLGAGNVESPILGSETSDFPVRHRGMAFLSRLLELARPARAGRAPGGSALGVTAMDTAGPAADVVTRTARLAVNAPIGASGEYGYPGDGSWLHLPHFPTIQTRAGRVNPMGPKTVSDTVEVPATYVGGPLG